MIKTNKFLILILALVASVAITSCVQDDDYTIPNSLGDEENAALTNMLANATEIDFAYLKALYNENGAATVPFFVENDVYVKGYVSSSDKSGNFFKEFFMQDAPVDPTGGLKIAIDQVDTYNQYNKGREVYINLKGLYIGEERVGKGVITIGGGTKFDQYGGTVTRLNINQIRTNLLRSHITEPITPLVVTFSEISNSHIGVFVQVDNVEFADDLIGKRYFDPIQAYDTQRTLQACDGFDFTEFSLETSSFADFKEHLLPVGNGSIQALVNKTFDGSKRILALNTAEDVNMEGERCETLDIGDFSVIMEEDFQTAIDNTNLDIPGWTNFSEAGSRVWREKFWQGNGYTEFSPFGSGDASNIGWLISPIIDVTGLDNIFLNFQSAQHHLDQDSPQNALQVYVSTDFDGTNVLAATWNPVSASLANSSNDWRDFIDSGLIDVSAYGGGNLYVAFKANGSDTLSQLSGSYMIDDVKVLAN